MRILDLKTMQQCQLSESTVVALGTFDGCHLGHVSVLRSAYLMAKRLKSKSVVYTFDSIPRANNSHSVGSIMTIEEKIKFIAKCGIDYIAVDDFSSVRNMSGEDFLNNVLKKSLNSIGACCGYNYRFGKNASCGTEELRAFFEKAGECVDICEKVTYNGENVSSTLIREKIKNGNVEEILSVCSPYSVYAQVVEGKRLGRTIGIPTINQIIPNGKLTPCRGVYITECELGEDVYPAITNVGVRPTVDGDGTENMETHIIGYDGDLYFSYVRVNFYKRLRDETKFDSLEKLQEQIKIDIEKAKDYFK